MRSLIGSQGRQVLRQVGTWDPTYSACAQHLSLLSALFDGSPQPMNYIETPSSAAQPSQAAPGPASQPARLSETTAPTAPSRLVNLWTSRVSQPCSCTLGHAAHHSFATQATRERRKTWDEKNEATGPIVPAVAPWPWVDPNRPFILPVLVPLKKHEPLLLTEAISKMKSNVAQASLVHPAAGLSGRERPLKARQDELVTMMIALAIDPRKADQIVRGVVTLPHSTGKAVRVCVFASGEAAELARKLGVEVIGDDSLIEAIVKSDNAISFDRLIATPEWAKKLARAGKALGPKGLMPNVKNGTLTEDIEGAVKEMRAGRIDYRVGRDRHLHMAVGRASFSEQDLADNIDAVMQSLVKNRPEAVPGQGLKGYVSKVYIKSSQTTSVPVQPDTCLKLLPT